MEGRKRGLKRGGCWSGWVSPIQGLEGGGRGLERTTRMWLMRRWDVEIIEIHRLLLKLIFKFSSKLTFESTVEDFHELKIASNGDAPVAAAAARRRTEGRR